MTNQMKSLVAQTVLHLAMIVLLVKHYLTKLNQSVNVTKQKV